MKLLNKAVTEGLRNSFNAAFKHFSDKSAVNPFFKRKIRAKLVL